MAASLGVLVALCLLSVAVAAQAANSMCSVPKVYEANVTVTMIEGVPSIPTGNGVLLADGTFHADLQTHKRIAVLEHIFYAQTSVLIKVVDDFTANITYVIFDKQGTCIKHPLSLQETSTSFKGSHKLGLKNALTVNIYEFNDTKTDTKNYTRLYMTEKECLPVSITAFSKTGSQQHAQASLFSGLSLGVKDPSVFNLPVYCQGQTPFPFGSQLIQDVLSRHRSRRALWA